MATRLGERNTRSKKTKSFVLECSTAAKIEALAEAMGQSESAIANRILEAGGRQMLLERASGPADVLPARAGVGAIEGVLRVRHPGELASDYPGQLSFEIIAECSVPEDPLPVLLALAFTYDAEADLWRRLTEEEARELVALVEGNSRLLVVTAAGVRWLVLEVRDVLNRSFAPPLRDLVVRLRRLPALCPACASRLMPSALPAFDYACPNTSCGRLYNLDPAGNLVGVAGATATPPRGSGPMSFAELRGILPPDMFSDEELRSIRTSSRELG